MNKILDNNETNKISLIVRVRCVECSILLLFSSEDIFPFKNDLKSKIIDGICRDCINKSYENSSN